ncbi:MAG: hypothetical protein ACK41E_10525 [Deinococcales bacterium]
MKAYTPTHKPSTTKSVACAALVKLEGLPRPLFLYFDSVKSHAKDYLLRHLKLHWEQVLQRKEPLPRFEVVACEEFLSRHQDIDTLARWLKSALPKTEDRGTC